MSKDDTRDFCPKKFCKLLFSKCLLVQFIFMQNISFLIFKL